MTDVFDEKQDLKNVRSFVAFLRSEYQRQLHDGIQGEDPLTIRLRNRLATDWPGDDVMQRIVLDVAAVMSVNKIKPEELK